MISGLIRLCLENRWLTILVVVAVCMLGIWAYMTIPVDAIPDLSDVQVILLVEWPGQNPQTIEDQVTYPLSSAMLNVTSVQNVRAKSFFGVSFVYVIFEDGTDLYWARDRVKEYLGSVPLPKDTNLSVRLGPDATGLGWVYMYTLEDTRGEYDLGELRALHDGYVSPILGAVEGVAEIAVVGGARRQYDVIVKPDRLLALGVTVPELALAIKKSNRESGGGAIELAEHEFMIRARGYLRSTEDIENVVIRAKRGTPVRVRDVADVVIGPASERGIAERNGSGEVVAGIVVMRQGKNARSVIREITRVIEKEVTPGLPPGVLIREAYNRAALIQRAQKTFSVTMFRSLIVVAVVCFFFLLHVRSALVAFITLPAGALIAFLGMRILGLPANIMSIAGITIAFGTMVDASICMVENAHRHLERGKERFIAIREACQEVGPGLFASLLVVTVSNLPLFALDDQAGRLFRPLAWTNTLSMAAACILSVTLIPPLVYWFVRGNIRPEKKNPVSRGLIGIYGPLVRVGIRGRWVVLGLALFVSLATIGPWRQLGSEFMPPLEEGDLLYMPTSVPGLGIGEARRALQTQDAILATFPEVKNVLGKIGRSSTATDSAPLEMVETTAQLYDEESWPARAIAPGWISDRAGELLRELGAPADLATAVEEMTRAKTNDWIRQSLGGKLQEERKSMIRGRAMTLEEEARFHEIRFSLQEKILRNLRDRIAPRLDGFLQEDLLSLLTAKGITPDKSRVSEWLEAHPPGRIPLVRVGFRELTREEMNRAITQPGMPNWFLMPIQTRIGMITTGMRGYLGLKIFGTDYERVEELAINLERILNEEVPGTVSAVADRAATGGYYLDVNIDQDACGRFNIATDEVERVIGTAIGGMPVTETIEGRYRFSVAVRYPRERRDDPEKLKRILVRLPGKTSDVVTLGQLASFELKRGPMVIKSENNLLVVYLPVEFEGMSLGEYVTGARKAIRKAVEEKRVTVPAGYTTKWSGQYEIMERANQRLLWIGFVTLFVIFVILFLYFRRLSPTLIVMGGTLLFAPVGAIWLTWFLDYNTSTAWWLGVLLLMGLSAETGIIMLVYLENAYKELLKKHGKMTREILDRAIEEGATQRVRPKVMTVMTDILAVVPMLLATGAGAATLQRMAAPLVGGLFTSLVLTLLVIPAAYRIVRAWGLPDR